MSPLLQWLIIAPLVAGAALFAMWRLTTTRLRLRMLAGLLQCLPQNAGGPVARWRTAIQQRIAADLASGCAACSKH